MTSNPPSFTDALEAAAQQWAAGLVASAAGDRDRQIQALQAQLTAAQAIASREAGQLQDAAAQLAAAQTTIAQQAGTISGDAVQLVADRAAIAALQAQIAALTGGKAPAPPAGFVVALSDDFTGPILNTAWWAAANNDYSSNELSLRLTADAVNTGQYLSLQALRQTVGTHQFTSGYVSNAGKQAGVIPYGRWLIRARWTPLYGLWPALWLRSASGLGEIDVMEAVGTWPFIAQTVHQSTNGDQDKSGYAWPFPAGWSPADWHVYGLDRAKDGTLTWTIDGTVTRWTSVGQLDNQQKPMAWLTGPTFVGGLNLRMNLQVGGSMPNSVLGGGTAIDAAKILPAGSGPASLDIDWVQVLAPAA